MLHAMRCIGREVRRTVMSDAYEQGSYISNLVKHHCTNGN
jgi:hypothetical protein